MAEKRADFVDAMRGELIQNVSSVMPIADELLQKKHINSEEYANIHVQEPKQNKMRELYKSLNNHASKVAFYEVLKKCDPHLLEELEGKCKRSAGAVIGDSQGAGGNAASEGSGSADPSSLVSSHVPETQTATGSQRVDAETLKERWQRISNRYRTKFEGLVNDRELKSVGSGKLFLCTNAKYKIGIGAEGTLVYIGMRDDGTEVAVKRMVKDNHEQLKNEMETLRDISLEHKNIVRYLDFTEDEYFYYLCLQLCEYNFEDYKETEKPDQAALKKVAKEVLVGLQALHNAGIIHRDLKPSNILIDVEGNVRLADFGISRKLNQDESTVKTSRAGSRGWEAAEILKQDANVKCGYKTSTDVQVAGMLVYYILSGGNHPFGKHLEVEANIEKDKYQLDERTDVEAKDLIERMIAHEPQDRLSIKEAVEHPYFWNDEGRDLFLRTVGDKEPVQNYKNTDPKLCDALQRYTEFSLWKSKITDLQPREKNIPDDLRGLLRFLRNRLVHRRVEFYRENMYKDLFPDVYVTMNQLAKDMGWK